MLDGSSRWTALLVDLESPHDTVRQEALEKLAPATGPDVLAALERMGRLDPNPALRNRARERARAAGASSVPETPEGTGERRALPAARPSVPPAVGADTGGAERSDRVDLAVEAHENLRSPDQHVRAQAARTLIAQPDAAAAPLLAALVAKEQDPFYLSALMLALAHCGGSEYAQTIARHLESASPRTRSAAIEALEATGDPDELEAVRPFLADPHHRVRGAAASALRDLERNAAVSCLDRMLVDPEEVVLRAALFSLRFFDGATALPRLREPLAAEALGPRSMAQASLVYMAERGSIAARELLSLARSGSGAAAGAPGEPSLANTTVASRGGASAVPRGGDARGSLTPAKGAGASGSASEDVPGVPGTGAEPGAQTRDSTGAPPGTRTGTASGTEAASGAAGTARADATSDASTGKHPAQARRSGIRFSATPGRAGSGGRSTSSDRNSAGPAGKEGGEVLEPVGVDASGTADRHAVGEIPLLRVEDRGADVPDADGGPGPVLDAGTSEPLSLGNEQHVELLRRQLEDVRSSVRARALAAVIAGEGPVRFDLLWEHFRSELHPHLYDASADALAREAARGGGSIERRIGELVDGARKQSLRAAVRRVADGGAVVPVQTSRFASVSEAERATVARRELRRASAMDAAVLIEGAIAVEAEVVELVLPLARGSDRRTRLVAVEALGQSRGLETEEALAELVNDLDADISIAACERLARLSPAAARDAIQDFIASGGPDAARRGRAMLALLPERLRTSPADKLVIGPPVGQPPAALWLTLGALLFALVAMALMLR